MAKKITDHDRIIDYCMTEPIEAVEQLLKTVNRILKNRSPKQEKTKGNPQRKPRNNVSAELPKASAAATSGATE